MDHIARVFIFRIEDEDHLQPPPSATAADHPPFAFLPHLRVRPAGLFDHQLGLLGGHAVLSDVVHVSGTLRVPLANGTRSVPDTLRP